MTNYKLLISPEYTLLLEKGIPTNWYFNTFTNKIYNTSGAEYSYSEHVFPIIGSTDKSHNVAMLNQENIQQKLQEKEQSKAFDLAVKFGYGSYLSSSEIKRLVDFYTYTQSLQKQSGKWTDEQVQSLCKAIIKGDFADINNETIEDYFKSIQEPVMYDVEIHIENYYESSMNEQPPLSVRPKLTAAGEILITKILTAWKLTNG